MPPVTEKGSLVSLPQRVTISDPSNQDLNITFVEANNVRFFAPGYEYAKPSPTAWIEADISKLPSLIQPSEGKKLHVLTTEKTANKRILIHVNLLTESSAQRFNELTGGHFKDRLKALRDINKLEDASRLADYQGLTDIPEVALTYNRLHGEMQQAFSAFCVAENSLKAGQEGLTQDAIDKLREDSDAKMTAYNDFMQTLRDAYLRSQGFEPIDPIKVRDSNRAPKTTLSTLPPM